MTETPRLQTLFWESTLRCNAYCEFCGSRCGDYSTHDLDGDIVRRAFKQISNTYDASQIMINVTGGEPLLRKDLFEIMAYANSLGYPWGVVTNGVLITDDIIKQMQKTNMRTISISIDGLYEMHEETRKLPGSFPKIIDAIKKLRKADFLDCLQITTVVTKKNIDHLEEMYKYFTDLSIDSWRLALVDPIGRGEKQKSLFLGKKELEKYFTFIDTHQFNGNMILTTSCSHYLGDHDTRYRSHSFTCLTGISIGSILANGDIFVCPNVPRLPKLIQGNITTDRFTEVWENKYEWFRNPENRRGESCKNCPSWEKCKGDSLHTWDFEEKMPKFCFREFFSIPEKNFDLPDDLKTRIKGETNSLRGFKISYGSSSTKKVYLLPSASAELFHYFHWGKNHPSNICELMAGLIGHCVDDTIYIEALIPVFLESRGKVEAMFSERSHSIMMDELKIMNEHKKEADSIYQIFKKPFSLVGYVHTHPRELYSCMSNPDLDLHKHLKEIVNDFSISGIINPQKKELKLFWDSIYSPVDTILLMDETELKKWE